MKLIYFRTGNWKLSLFLITFFIFLFTLKYLLTGRQLPSRYVVEIQNDKFIDTKSKGKYAGMHKDELLNKHILFFNRISKTGSEMIVLLLQWLRGENSFMHYRLKNTISHHLSVKEQEILIQEMYDTSIKSKEKWLSFDRHVYFIDFVKFGLKMPVYFNIVRDPIDKIVSSFYYSRITPRPGAFLPANHTSPKAKKYETIEQCLESNGPECTFHYGEKYSLSIPYFCGHEQFCSELNNLRALDKAKENVENWYPIVGVLEMLNTSLSMCQKILPHFFSGVSELYNNDLKAIHYNRNKEKPEIQNWVREKLKVNLTLEMQFYNYLSNRLKKQHEEYLSSL